MAGRAGRKGAGRARGEAFLIASNKGQATKATAFMNAGLAPVKRYLSTIQHLQYISIYSFNS